MKKKLLIIMLTLLVWNGQKAQSVYPGLFEGKMALKAPEGGIKAKSFDIRNVRLLPSRFRENMERDSAWIMSLSTERILHSFRTTAGKWAGTEGGYMTVKKLGGWESLDCELRGHTAGHLLSACALMWRATGSRCFKQKGDSLVTGLKEVQGEKGYLSAYPEELINRNIRGERVWAPWYTLHKILSGLIDQYLYGENEEAIDVAKKMCDWAYGKLKDVGDAERERMLRNEFGGINESFYNMYSITGEERYKWLAHYFYHKTVMEPLKSNDIDFGTKHTNTYIPKVIAEARNYEITGDKESGRIAENFYWGMQCGHLYVTGSCSDKEHYFDPSKFSEHITGYTGETCCTYNMLKLSKHLFCWTGDSRIADYYERALYNHILGQQDTKSGMVAYFLPMMSGSYKVYSTPENSFWCCVGSGFESHAKYAESIYYHEANGVYVNLMIPSELQWEQKGVHLIQRTTFPNEPETRITIKVEQSKQFDIYLRQPAWSSAIKVYVNGKKAKCDKTKAGYVGIRRRWKDGDEVRVEYTMGLHIEYAHGSKERGAVMWGPIVLAGRMGTEGMQSPAPTSDSTKYNDYYRYDYHVPTDLRQTLHLGGEKQIERKIKRKSGTLDFETKEGYTLSPLYDIHRERYVVYWKIE